MNNNLHIRDIHDQALDEAAPLIRDSYLQYINYMPADAWEHYLENIVDVRSRLEQAQLIVAEVDGILVGTVTLYLNVTNNSTMEWPPDWAGIRLLAVHPQYRSRGVGRALMDECIRRSREHRIKTIGLHTTEMMDMARCMYERMGFRRVPEYDFHPHPDVVVMAYRLDI